MAKLACCEKLKSCNAMAAGGTAEFIGNSDALLAAIELSERLDPSAEKELVMLYTERADSERKFAERARALSARVWAPLLT